VVLGIKLFKKIIIYKSLFLIFYFFIAIILAWFKNFATFIRRRVWVGFLVEAKGKRKGKGKNLNPFPPNNSYGSQRI